MSKTYKLFISHSWAHDDSYDKVIEMLESQGISYYDHSLLINDPVHTDGTDKELEAAIDAKIKGTSCVVIMAGVYSTYSKWINKEIDMAIAYGKSIIAINLWIQKKHQKL